MACEHYTKKARGLSLLSGGLDSQLAVCVLRDAGAEVEAVTFETPFFASAAARKAAAAFSSNSGVDFSAIGLPAESRQICHPPSNRRRL